MPGKIGGIVGAWEEWFVGTWDEHVVGPWEKFKAWSPLSLISYKISHTLPGNIPLAYIFINIYIKRAYTLILDQTYVSSITSSPAKSHTLSPAISPLSPDSSDST